MAKIVQKNDGIEKKTDVELWDESVIQANKQWYGDMMFEVQVAAPIRGWRKAHLRESPQMVNEISMLLISGVWEGKFANLVMGATFENAESDSVDSSLCRIVPITGDKLQVVHAIIPTGDDNREGFLFYGGQDGVRIEVLGRDNHSEQATRPLIFVQNGLDLPDEIQAFMKRGYNRKALALMGSLQVSDRQEMLEKVYDEKDEDEYLRLMREILELDNPDKLTPGENAMVTPVFDAMVRAQFKLHREVETGAFKAKPGVKITGT